MLGEEKEVLASVIEELEEEISQSSTNYSTDQSQDNGRSRVSRTACLDYLLTRISCPLFKPKFHIRNPYRVPLIFSPQSGLAKDFSAKSWVVEVRL